VRVSRITPNLGVTDIEAVHEFFTGFLGLDHEEMGLDWVTRFVVPATGEHVQVVTHDASAPADSSMTLRVDDVDAAYDQAVERDLEIVHPLVTEPWGVRRFFVRVPGGPVLNIAQEHR
jgi:predicted enzyme related to lactoylglutathione lyase